MAETTWNTTNGQPVRVNHPRAVQIARRIEKAVKMKLTSKYASHQRQVGTRPKVLQCQALLSTRLKVLGIGSIGYRLW